MSSSPRDPAPPAPADTPATPDGAGGYEAGAPAYATGRTERVGAAVRRWQRHLVDLGGRNALLWFEDLPTGTLDLTTAHPGGVSMLMAGRATRLSDLVREPSAFAEARRRAQAIREKTLELDEERGLVTGYVAIGMATWSIPGARRAPKAPVLLRTCTLHPTGSAHRDYDVDLGDEVLVNPVLVNYLASEQGVVLDPAALADLAYTQHRFDPQPVFRELSRMCRSVPDFGVSDRKVVGTFTVAKLPLVADLTDQAGALADHDVVAALAGDSAAAAAISGGDEVVPAVDVNLARELLVLDADATQEAVVEAARGGANLVVRGAPGTGTTQTVANLVAALAAEGKRVLVVSEKRAALTDLSARLFDAGLGDLALDCHEGGQDRGAAARAVAETIAFRSPREPDVADLTEQLGARRGQLARHREALHARRDPWGASVFEGQVALARLARRDGAPSSRVRLTGAVLAGIDLPSAEAHAEQLREIAARGAWSQGRDDDPWAGARILTEEDADRARRAVTTLAGHRLDRDRKALDALLAGVGLPAARTAADWESALTVIGEVRSTLEQWSPEVYTSDLDLLLAATGDRSYRQEHGRRVPWWSRLSLRRRAKAMLRPGHTVGDLHEALAAAHAQRDAWRSRAGQDAVPAVPEGLDEGRRTWETLAEDLRWLGGRLQATTEGGALTEAPLDELAVRLNRMAARTDRLAVLPAVVPVFDELAAAGLGPLVEDLMTRQVSPSAAAEEARFVWWASFLDAVAAADPLIGEHDGAALREALVDYARLDAASLRAGAGRVAARVATRLREDVAMYADQADVVREQARRTSHHLPLPQLIGQAADVLFAARPCWMMSPLVVPSVVPPGTWFDVVVIEEASQMHPAVAVSALTRAGRVVVVGDEHQLAPSGFTMSPAAPGDAGSDDMVTVGDTSSVFDVLRRCLPVYDLGWHYRSEDERLFAFANAHIYGGELVTFPGTGRERPISLVSVERPAAGAGAPEGAGDAAAVEAAEVDRVVDLVVEHARSHADESLGVLTLTASHAARLLAAIRDRLDHEVDAAVVAFFDEAAPEAFFVKPIDRAQGDERDAIVLSVGYAPTDDGRVLHRFGPLNLDGGERRLTVAVTRGRRRLTVVSSLRPADLDTGKLKSRGAQMLHDLLEYAQSGGDAGVLRTQVPDTAEKAGVDVFAAQGSAAPTPPVRRVGENGTRDVLLTELAARLRAEGLTVHEGYGTSRLPLDLAVEDPYVPGRLVVAVDSDGERYAAMPATRDRERLRGDHLGRLGWEYVRVWSTDVFRDPARDVARVLDAVRAADGKGPRPGRARGLPAGGLGW